MEPEVHLRSGVRVAVELTFVVGLEGQMNAPISEAVSKLIGRDGKGRERA
jgi:hypothetical protein